MSPSRLRCGVRVAAVLSGVAAVALASIHFSGRRFSTTFAVGAVILLTLVCIGWLVVELLCVVVARLDLFREETQARYDALQRGRSDAEAIAARAIEATFDRLSADQDDDASGAVVNGDFSGRRRR